MGNCHKSATTNYYWGVNWEFPTKTGLRWFGIFFANQGGIWGDIVFGDAPLTEICWLGGWKKVTQTYSCKTNGGAKWRWIPWDRIRKKHQQKTKIKADLLKKTCSSNLAGFSWWWIPWDSNPQKKITVNKHKSKLMHRFSNFQGTAFRSSRSWLQCGWDTKLRRRLSLDLISETSTNPSPLEILVNMASPPTHT